MGKGYPQHDADIQHTILAQRKAIIFQLRCQKRAKQESCPDKGVRVGGPGGIRTHDFGLRRPTSWSWLDYGPEKFDLAMRTLLFSWQGRDSITYSRAVSRPAGSRL